MAAARATAFAIERGQQTVRELAIAVRRSNRRTIRPCCFHFDLEGLPAVEKPVVLSVISPDMLGNLVANGDFEMPDSRHQGPAGWRADSGAKRSSAEGLGDGLGERVIKFEGSDMELLQPVDSAPRRADVPVHVLGPQPRHGLRLQHDAAACDGREIRLYDTQVIRCGDNNPHWQVFTCRKQMPAEWTAQASLRWPTGRAGR